MKFAVKVGVLGVALIMALGTAWGFGRNKIVYKSFNWKVYTSPHFQVHYYPEEEEFLQRVVSDAESSYLRISKFLDHEIEFRIPLIYYRTHGDFEQTNVDLSEIPQGVGAFAEPFQNRIVIPIDQPPDRFAAVLRHELTHIFEFNILYGESLKRTIRSEPPLWIMEGLASYLGQDETNIDRMVIRDAVVNNYIPPIEYLDPRVVDGFLVYRFGHAIFDWMEAEKGPEGVRNFLFEYRKVLLTQNLEKALKEAFGLDYYDFNRKFGKYLRKKYFPLLMEKEEPLDYGKEIGIKKPGRYTFSPTLSPSGELVAALATPSDELDVVILQAKGDNKKVHNLTAGFSNHYEEIVTGAFDAKRDLTWSPEGDRVAFFVRKENRRPLLIYDALSGHKLDEIETHIDNCFSPQFSPDGSKIAFSGNKDGIVDIFELDLTTKGVRNVTSDVYFDSNPSWSPEGKEILYNRRVGLNEKIFMVDLADASQKRQLTFGATDDVMPIYGRDPSLIYFASDRWGGIYQICQLDTKTLEIGRLTDLVGGGFAPVQLADEHGEPQLAYVGYSEGTFRLYRMAVKTPTEKASAEEPTGAAEILAYQPELNLTLDEAEKRPYTRKWSVDAPAITVGAASDGTFFTDTAVFFSDLLGDYRIAVRLNSVSTFTNLNVGYLNFKNRLQWGAEIFDNRDFYSVQSGSGNFERQDDHVAGASVLGQYPFNRYYRVEGQLGYVYRNLTYPVTVSTANADVLSFQSFTDQFAVVSLGFSGDTTRFRSFGGYQGKRFQFTLYQAAQISGDTGSSTIASLDYRGYGHITRRSLFAWRLFGLGQFGDGAGIYSIGGYNDLRGYEFREFFGNRAAFTNLELRFPLIDELRFPIGSFHDIRGTIFLDIGSAYFNDGSFYSQNLNTFRTFGVFTDRNGDGEVDTFRTTDFIHFKAWDSENDRLQDLRASWGVGFNFFFGGLEWHWDFAHQFPYTDFEQVCVNSADKKISCSNLTDLAATRLDKIEVSKTDIRTNFWIGFSF